MTGSLGEEHNDKLEIDDGPPLRQSPFVTRIAWCAILVYGFATLIAALYAVARPPTVAPLAVRHRGDLAELIGWLRGDLSTDWASPDANPWVLTSRLGALIALGLNVVTLVAAAGLLRKRRWARWMFIATLVLGVVEAAASLVLDVMPQYHRQWEVGLVVWALACGWVIFKLCSADGCAVRTAWRLSVRPRFREEAPHE